MKDTTYEEIVREAEKLPAVQRLMLIERLAHDMCVEDAPEVARITWEEMAGTAPYPLCGEDAQEWVSRTRQESDGARGVK